MAQALSPTNYADPSAQHASDRTVIYSGADNELRTIDFLGLVERSTDPANPPEGVAVFWMSNGLGITGADGDILVKVTAGGVTREAILFRFAGGQVT